MPPAPSPMFVRVVEPVGSFQPGDILSVRPLPSNPLFWAVYVDGQHIVSISRRYTTSPLNVRSTQ